MAQAHSIENSRSSSRRHEFTRVLDAILAATFRQVEANCLTLSPPLRFGSTTIQCSRFFRQRCAMEKWGEISETVYPRQTIFHPALVFWHMGQRFIEAASVDLKPLRNFRIVKHQRCSAVATKRAFTTSKDHELRVAFIPRKRSNGKKCPCHKRSAAGFPAVDAMTERGSLGRAPHGIADGAT